MSRINILWVIDHVCYDGQLHGGGRLYWNAVPHFEKDRFRIIPCLLRADQTLKNLFKTAPAKVRILDKGKYDPTTLWTFVQLIRKEMIDVLHLHCYGASTFGRLAGLLTGVPSIIHDYDTQIYFPYPPYLWIFDRLLAPITRKALAASPMVRAYMINKRAIPASKVEMMFHAIPPDKYNEVSPEEIKSTRISLGLMPDDKIILSPTKIGPDRGNKFLLRAAAKVLEQDSKAFFIIAFKWTYFHRNPNDRFVQVNEIKSKDKTMAEFYGLAKSLGISHRVIFRESWDNLKELYALSHCVVAPFMSERFSSVNLIEAMAQGTPMVATDLGEQRDFIENGENGFLVSPEDENAFASKILHIIGDQEEYTRMSEMARIKSKQYSLDAFVENLEKLYSELAANDRKNLIAEGHG